MLYYFMINSFILRLEIHHVPVVTENLVLVEGRDQVEIDQFLDHVLPELLVRKNYKIHRNVPFLLGTEAQPGMVSKFIKNDF